MFLLALFVLSWRPAQASLEFTPRLSEACRSILHLDFASGQTLLAEEKLHNPDNNLVLLFENNIDFLKAFMTEEAGLFNTFKKNSAIRAERIEDENKNSPWYYFTLAEMKLQDSFLKVKFREFVSASFSMRSAYRMLEKNARNWPTFPLNGKGLGLVHVAVGCVPPEFRWVAELAGMHGTVEQGIAELRHSLTTLTGLYAPFSEEVLFFLSTLQASLSFPPTELEATAFLVKPYAGDSPLLTYSYMNLCIRSGHSERALDLVNRQFEGKYPFRFLDYKKGMLLLYRQDPDAEAYFRQYLRHYRGMNFIKSTWQKIAWIQLLRGDTANYRKSISTAATSGIAFIDDDKQAQAEAKSAELPNVRLLRARLLYDGGYMERAMAEFRDMDVQDFPLYRDQLELTYRLARIYRAMGMTDKAMPLFRQTLRNGEQTSWHYSANSALMLGNIHEETGRNDSAAYYYKRCLDMRHHEYQNSIDQKAQAGLERIRGN